MLVLIAALTAALAKPPATPDAAAGPPKCEWLGSGKDPFTGADQRMMELTVLRGSFVLTFHPAAADVVPVDVKVTFGRATDQPLDQPIKLLLTDGSVAELIPVGPANGTLTTTRSSVRTKYEFKSTLAISAAAQLANGGATLVRVPFPGFQFDKELGKDLQAELAKIGHCVIHPD